MLLGLNLAVVPQASAQGAAHSAWGWGLSVGLAVLAASAGLAAFLLWKALKVARGELSLQNNRLLLAQKELDRAEKLLKILRLENTHLRKLSIVAQATENAVMLLDAQGNLEWANVSFQKLHGCTLEEYIKRKGQNLKQVNSLPNIDALYEKAITTGTSVSYDSYTTEVSGERRWFHTTLTPVYDDSGKVSQLVAIDTDITRLKHAEQELTAHNEHMKASIQYALNIQEAILPIKERMDKCFESFIIYKPKDIVSGDFYWFSHIEIDDKFNQKTFVAVVDCTGHGVPGAFMSLIGNRLLNEIVNEKGIFKPNRILKFLNVGIIKALKQTQTDNSDGMDVCLVLLEKLTDGKHRVTFSGAKRPLLYYTRQEKELFALKGDRKTIGGVRKRKTKAMYSNQEVILSDGDMLYLTTDGLVDQNAPDRSKFGSKRFRDLVVELADQPIDQQRVLMEEALAQHQRDALQRDDITIVGIRL